MCVLCLGVCEGQGWISFVDDGDDDDDDDDALGMSLVCAKRSFCIFRTAFIYSYINICIYTHIQEFSCHVHKKILHYV